MSSPKSVVHVDARDYQVINKWANQYKTRFQAEIVKDGVHYSISDLCDLSGMTHVTVRKRVRALLPWKDLISESSSKIPMFTMPSVKDCLTGDLSWDLLKTPDYKVVETVADSGGRALALSYKGQVIRLSDLIDHFKVSCATVRRRLEVCLDFHEVFDLNEPLTGPIVLSDGAEVEVEEEEVTGGAFDTLIDSLSAKSLFIAGRSALFPAQNPGPLYAEGRKWSRRWSV